MSKASITVDGGGDLVLTLGPALNRKDFAAKVAKLSDSDLTALLRTLMEMDMTVASMGKVILKEQLRRAHELVPRPRVSR